MVKTKVTNDNREAVQRAMLNVLQSCPALWNKNNADYNNKNVKDLQWDKIIKEVEEKANVKLDQSALKIQLGRMKAALRSINALDSETEREDHSDYWLVESAPFLFDDNFRRSSIGNTTMPPKLKLVSTPVSTVSPMTPIKLELAKKTSRQTTSNFESTPISTSTLISPLCTNRGKRQTISCIEPMSAGTPSAPISPLIMPKRTKRPGSSFIESPPATKKRIIEQLQESIKDEYETHFDYREESQNADFGRNISYHIDKLSNDLQCQAISEIYSVLARYQRMNVN